MNETLKLLMIEDSDDDAELITRAIQGCGLNFSAKQIDTPAEVARELQDGSWDAILCDYSMPKLTAQDAFELLRKSGRDIPFIVVSGSIGERMAVELMKLGIHDYIIKDRLARLGPAIERAIQEAKNRASKRAADEEQKKWAEDLARSNEDLQRFAYIASHDLSEPLRMIAIHVQLLDQNLAKQLDARTRQSMSYIVEGIR